METFNTTQRDSCQYDTCQYQYEHQRALNRRTPFHFRQVSHRLTLLLLASWAFK